MATLIKTVNGNQTGGSSKYQFYIICRLYKDSDTGSGYTMHWNYSIYFVKWDVVTRTFTYVHDGSTASVTMNVHGTNLDKFSWNSGTKTVAYGSSISTSGSAAYKTDGGTTYKSSVSTSYTVPKPTYSVSYNANGGTGAPASQTKTYGTALTLSSVQPTRTGYNFISWNTNAEGTGTTYNPGGSYTNNAALTLYAIWEEQTVKWQITSMTINRCLQDGTLNNKGTYCKVEITYRMDPSVWWSVDNVISRIAVKLNDNNPYIEIPDEGEEVSGNKEFIVGPLENNTTYVVSATIWDSAVDSNPSAELPSQYSDRQMRMLYALNSIYRPKLYINNWFKVEPVNDLNRNDSLIAFPATSEDAFGEEKLYGIVEDDILELTSNNINILSTNNFTEHMIYANSLKNWGIHLYSAGEWNDNTNALENHQSAHIIDITHSMLQNIFINVPDGHVINRIQRLCTKENGIITNNITNTDFSDYKQLNIIENDNFVLDLIDNLDPEDNTSPYGQWRYTLIV